MVIKRSSIARRVEQYWFARRPILLHTPHPQRGLSLLRDVVSQCESSTALQVGRGTEFSAYRSIERSLGVPVYFVRPYRSTDKPHIEHANALIRQYLPKHSSFADLTAKEVKEIEWSLNNRPRKKLGYRTPHEFFYLNLQPKYCTS